MMICASYFAHAYKYTILMQMFYMNNRKSSKQRTDSATFNCIKFASRYTFYKGLIKIIQTIEKGHHNKGIRSDAQVQ